MIQFSPLMIWRDLQQRLELYRDNPIDRPLIQLTDNIVTALQANPSHSAHATFGLSVYLLQQPRLESKIRLKLDNEADRQLIEQKLCAWLDDNLIRFNPTGCSALSALVSWVDRSCSWWIHDLRKEHAQQGTGEISLDASTGENHSSRLDTFDAASHSQDTAAVLGFLPVTAFSFPAQPIPLTALQPIAELPNYFGKIRDGYGLLESAADRPEVIELLAQINERCLPRFFAQSYTTFCSDQADRGKKIDMQDYIDSAQAVSGVRYDQGLTESEHLAQKQKTRHLADQWFNLLSTVWSV